MKKGIYLISDHTLVRGGKDGKEVIGQVRRRISPDKRRKSFWQACIVEVPHVWYGDFDTQDEAIAYIHDQRKAG